MTEFSAYRKTGNKDQPLGYSFWESSEDEVHNMLFSALEHRYGAGKVVRRESQYFHADTDELLGEVIPGDSFEDKT